MKLFRLTTAGALGMGFLALASLAQEKAPAPSPRPVAPARLDSESRVIVTPDESVSNAILRAVAPGVFELGKIRINKQERSVTFPAELNMYHGMVEYALVAAYGKTHESILQTTVEPYHLHVAMLLLDAKGGNAAALTNQTSAAAPPDGGPISSPSREPLRGDRINIDAAWTADGKTVKRPLGQMVFNSSTRAPMTQPNWIYNGSRMWEGRFLAQLTGSIISLINDPDALVNSSGPGFADDEIWMVNTNGIPAANTPVQVTIRMSSKSGQ